MSANSSFVVQPKLFVCFALCFLAGAPAWLIAKGSLSFAAALCYDRGGKSNKPMLDSNPFEGMTIGVLET